MKKNAIIISVIICLLLSNYLHAQEYSFVPKDLKLISMNELMSKPPPSDVELVYYEDGTKTTFHDVMPGLMTGSLMPKMYVNDKGEYKVLVVVGDKLVPKTVEIAYKGIPKKIKNLGYSLGNPNSEVVIINTQGGPFHRIFTDGFEDLFVNVGGIDLNNTFIINVHQVQTLYPQRFDKKELPFEEIKKQCEESTKILDEVVRYFKSENKKVLVSGFSYGAFAVQDLLANYGNSADGYLIMVGRLDMTEQVWKSFSEGKEVMFEDGTKVINPASETEESESNSPTPQEKNLLKLAAGFGHKRYTKLLKNIDLSNMIYVYGKKDEAVGSLTKEELSFLKSKKVKVIASESGHDTMQLKMKSSLNLLLKMK